MRVVLITQNDVFYLPAALEYLLDRMPEHSQVVGAVVLPASPFGRRQGFVGKMLQTWRGFGPRFFVRYGFKFAAGKLFGEDVRGVLRRRGVPRIELERNINESASLHRIRQARPDLLVSIAGNQIFKSPLIELPRRGTLNLHTALLPKYRGLMPTFWVLKNGERFTGVSVFFVDEGIDSGPILVQRRIEIGNRTQEELIVETKRLGMEAVAEAIDRIHRGDLQLIDNSEEGKTYHSFPTRSDVREFYAQGKRFF